MNAISHATALDAHVPRYTSYPTAPHFVSDVDSGTFGRWLEQLEPGSDISLYVHIPYCDTLCWFCACRTQGTRKRDQVVGYLAALEVEIARVAERIPASCRVSRLHLGGGSPTIMTPDEIASLFASLRRAFTFAPGAEIAVEIDPRDIDVPRLDALAAAGLTRASIGVQDFDPKVQMTINRMQGHDLTRGVIEGLRARGVGSLNIDALYGLPYQTCESIERTIRQVIALRPDRLALFGYAHVPWMARRQQLIPEDALPKTEERLAQSELAKRLFEEAGYVPIGIDHFALPADSLARASRSGGLRRNFQGYTDDDSETLVGIGASAISRLPQGYAQNAAKTAEWLSAVNAGGLTTQRGHAFSPEDRLRARAIERLMCEFAYDEEALKAEFGPLAERLRPIEREVLDGDYADAIEATAKGFVVRPEMRSWTRLIAAKFDAYLASAPARHSKAI